MRTDGISKTFGPKLVLENAAFQVMESDKVALVGPNGSGKSTIFKLISGDLTPDSGDLHMPEGLRISYMPQISSIPGNLLVREVLSAPMPEVRRLERELAAIEEQMADPAFWESPDASQENARYADLHARAATARATAQPLTSPILSDLGVAEESFPQEFGDLSGGEKTKVLLARALANHEEMDLLMLDEPTNHLDIETVEWIEELLVASDAAVMLAAHDKYLLDNIASKVLEVDRRHVIEWSGNYTDYRTQRDALTRAFEAKRKRDANELQRQMGIIEEIKRRNRFDAQAQSKETRLAKWRARVGGDDAPSAQRAFRLDLKATSKRS
ncbi:MAG TPA: ATP-binding cassette domain-containing protein, partial [Burkholderiales bacterium]|nr:ATP-binding cassette domain-containing protein [Burkholderiales bacterium]